MSKWKINNEKIINIQECRLSQSPKCSVKIEGEPLHSLSYHEKLMVFSVVSEDSTLERNIHTLNWSSSRPAGELNGQLYIDCYQASPASLRTNCSILYRPEAPGIDKLLEGIASEPKQIKSPITGVVLKVLVKNGQRVKEGETVCVIEAMKMENQITSPISGVVDSVSCEGTESVSSNQYLMTINPEEELN